MSNYEKLIAELDKYLRSFADNGDPRMQDYLIQRAATAIRELQGKIARLEEYGVNIKNRACQIGDILCDEKDTQISDLRTKLTTCEALLDKDYEDMGVAMFQAEMKAALKEWK